MKQVAKFEKVSFTQFKKDVEKCRVIGKNTEEETLDLEKIYNDIKLPTRATQTSAGYDFYMPYDVILNYCDSVVIPTGIRCKFEDPGYSLNIFPKSGLGFKYRLSLANTVGIIDSDYYFANNEGHIMAKVVYDGFLEIADTLEEFDGLAVDESIKLEKGSKFVQGIFQPFGITIDDNASGSRIGGFGSTGK